MKLLYTLTAYPPYIGGAQLHQHLLAQHLSSRHSIQVVCHWDSNRTDWLTGTTINAPSEDYDYCIDSVPVHRISLTPIEKARLLPLIPLYYPFMSEVLPLLSKSFESKLKDYAKSIDLVHNVRIGREGLSYASLQVARQHNIPFIFTPVHHPRWVGWRYREFLKIYRLADRVIALTQTEKNILVSLGVKAEQIVVTGHGPILAPQSNPENFLISYPEIHAPFVLFIGQHYAYKGFQQLLQAAPIVWKKYPDLNFVFIGPPVKRSEQYFKTVDSRVHRLGSVDLQTKTNALAACTLLCVPSTQESFGGVYTEAWAFRKPVIGCPIPAVSEVVTDGVDGLLIGQDPSQIADAICQLLANPILAESMGQAGHRKVQEHFTWERLAQKTEQVYQSVRSGKSL